MSDLVADVNSQDFESVVLKAESPVLVDFWAPWCGPCRLIAPRVEEVAQQLKERLKVVKVNTDEAQDIATRYNVMSIPTLIVFKEGQVVDTILNGAAMGAQQIADRIKSHLS
jgi:thioredoxin 1